MITLIENKLEKREMKHLIDIYEQNVDKKKIDKHGTEYISWFDLPTEIDDTTLYISRILTRVGGRGLHGWRECSRYRGGDGDCGVGQ